MAGVSARRVLAQGRHLRFVEVDGWEFVERNRVSGIAAVVAVTESGRVLLVEQYRAPVAGQVIELPAGLAGDSAERTDEPVAAAAARELLEETGYAADSFEALSDGPPSVGVTSEVVTLFRAHGLKRVGPGGGDGTESIAVHEVALEQVAEWLEAQRRRGCLIDPKVYAGLYFLKP